MEYSFEKINKIFPDELNLENFSFNQKIQILKAINENFDLRHLKLLVNNNFSAEKIKVLIQILKTNISFDLKTKILESNLDEYQLLEIKKCIKRGVSKKVIVFLVNTELDRNVIYTHRKYFEKNEIKGKKYEEKTCK